MKLVGVGAGFSIAALCALCRIVAAQMRQDFPTQRRAADRSPDRGALGQHNGRMVPALVSAVFDRPATLAAGYIFGGVAGCYAVQDVGSGRQAFGDFVDFAACLRSVTGKAKLLMASRRVALDRSSLLLDGVH